MNNPALRYFGGKWRIAPEIIKYFPKHTAYLEPCCGGGSILLRKQRSSVETINDLDGAVTTFFRVVRDRADELARSISLTPYSEIEYRTCADGVVVDGDDLETARRLYVVSWQSYAGYTRTSSGFRFVINADRRNAPSLEFYQLDRIYRAADRLCGVQIHCMDALELIERHLEQKGCLIYVDPPYVKDTRKSVRYVMDDFDHVSSAELLRRHKGAVVVSGYQSDLYADLYEAYGWKRVDIAGVRCNGDAVRTESIWLNERAVIPDLFTYANRGDSAEGR